MSITKKIGKRGGILLILLLIAGTVATGALYNYWLQLNKEYTIEDLFMYQDDILNPGTMGAWTVMGDSDIVYDPDGLVGNDSEFFSFNISLSDVANGDIRLEFTITEPTLLEVNVTIWDVTNNVEVENGDIVTFAPDSHINFEYRIHVNPYCEAGNYQTSFKVEMA